MTNLSPQDKSCGTVKFLLHEVDFADIAEVLSEKYDVEYFPDEPRILIVRIKRTN